MRPLEIALENCDELIEDSRRKILGNEARLFAEKGLFPRKDWHVGQTYWESIIKDHEFLFWMDCYYKRLARIRRLNDRPR